MARTRTPPHPPAPPRPDHPADAAVRRGSGDGLPADQQAGLAAVLAGFRHYEAGDDEAARQALQAVGLTSPFLEWKVLLRGLMAYAAGDDARAVENWRRLDPARLSARLAAPLRARLDPEFAAAQPAASAARLRARYEALAGGDLPARLRALQAELGRDKRLTRAWKLAAAAAPLLRRVHPDLEARFARGMYEAIAGQGEQADLAKYRNLFGPPPDDPQFHKLEALGYEAAGQFDVANDHWARYEAWLGSSPSGWPAGVARRARAIILHRMGQNAAALHARPAAPPDDIEAAFAALFRAPERRRPVPGPKPETYFLRSIELAPEWAAPARELFRRYLDQDRPAEAERVARGLLARKPDDLMAIEGLAVLVQREGRADEALNLWKTALATNPLDRRLRALTAHAYHAAARRELAAGRAAAAETVLDEGKDVCAAEFPAGYQALRAVTARKLGRPADADAARDAAAAVPGGRLAAALFVAVDSAMAKLKPADKRAADQAFAAAIEEPPTPLEVNLLHGAWDSYHLSGVSYRGQKTQEKKILALAEKCLAADAPERDFEALCLGLAARQHWKLAEAAAAKCERRFPRNPFFKVALAEALHARNPRYQQERRILRLLDEAKGLIGPGADARTAGLTDVIDRLRKHYSDPADTFDFLFGRAR